MCHAYLGPDSSGTRFWCRLEHCSIQNQKVETACTWLKWWYITVDCLFFVISCKKSVNSHVVIYLFILLLIVYVAFGHVYFLRLKISFPTHGRPIRTRSSATAEKQRVSCPHGGRGLGPPAHSPFAPLAIPMRMVESESHNVRTSSVPSVKRTLRSIGHSRSFKPFKVILIGADTNPDSRTVCCRNVQSMPTLFLKLTKIRQRENGKFVDFNDLTKVWRRPSKKRLWISTNGSYCQKLELLAYIFVANSVGLRSLVFP